MAKATRLNKRRSMSGHHSASSGTTTWLTPRRILEALGEFELDPCAAPLPRPWPTAKRHIVEAEDGLSQPWGGRVFLNPPYGTQIMRPWLVKMADHQHGTALIFARTETEAFQEYVFGAASAILFLRGRLHFCFPDGREAEFNSGAPSVLVAYGRADAAILESCGLLGHFVDARQ